MALTRFSIDETTMIRLKRKGNMIAANPSILNDWVSMKIFWINLKKFSPKRQISRMMADDTVMTKACTSTSEVFFGAPGFVMDGYNPSPNDESTMQTIESTMIPI
jgi:hypothetical protein